MNPRERMIATLNHQKPDIVPIQLGWRKELWQPVMDHYKVDSADEVVKILEADLYRSADVKMRWTDYEKRVNGSLKSDFGDTGPVILHDERTFEDEWGVVERVGKDGKYLEWVSGPFAETDDLDRFDWPGGSVIVDDPDLAKRVAEFKRQGYWVVGSSGQHPFKQAWRMRGFENFLCDYVANPEFVEALYDRILDHTVAVCKRSAAAGVDMLHFWGDVAMQDRMIVPPEQWRQLDKQAWRRIIAETRKVNPQVKFFFHCDGDVRPIIGDLIEAGFDILNPVQPECLNPGLIKRQWGDRLTLDGGGSIQRTLPLGTLDDVRREVDFLMRTCAWNGGYIFRASNVVGFDCPIENVIAFYELARDYDLSKLEGPPDQIPDPPPCMSVKIHA
jgi:uroporphyrinogen decarboxylase